MGGRKRGKVSMLPGHIHWGKNLTLFSRSKKSLIMQGTVSNLEGADVGKKD